MCIERDRHVHRVFWGVLACLASLATPAVAQPASLIAALWGVYQSRCGLALSNPQEFLNTLPPTNTRGGPNAVATADQTLLVSSTLHDGFVVDVEMLAQTNGLAISCSVAPAEQRAAALESYTAPEIEHALRAFFAAQNLQPLSGGALLNAYTGPQDGNAIDYEFATEVVLAGRTIPTRLHMGEAHVDMYFLGMLVAPAN